MEVSPRDKSLARHMPIFLLQQIIAPLGSLIVGGIGGILLSQMARAIGLNGIGDVLIVLCILATGFGFGCFTRSRFLEAGTSGRWVWVLPVCIWAWGFISDLLLHSPRLVADFLWPALSSTPDVGLPALLLTLPAGASCCYSIGIYVTDRWLNSRMRNSLHTA